MTYPLLLSRGELDALALLVGVPTFPGVSTTPAAEASSETVIADATTAYAALATRELLTLDEAENSATLSAELADVMRTVVSAPAILEGRRGGDAHVATWFVGETDAVAMHVVDEHLVSLVRLDPDEAREDLLAVMHLPSGVHAQPTRSVPTRADVDISSVVTHSSDLCTITGVALEGDVAYGVHVSWAVGADGSLLLVEPSPGGTSDAPTFRASVTTAAEILARVVDDVSATAS